MSAPARDQPAPALVLAEANAVTTGGAISATSAIPEQAETSTPSHPSEYHEANSQGPNVLGSSRGTGTLGDEKDHDQAVESVPTPAYSQNLNEVELDHDGLGTRANISHDGRVNININQQYRRLSGLLGSTLLSQLDRQGDVSDPPDRLPHPLAEKPGDPPPPPMNIVVQIVGSRGDVQPFVALGLILKNEYGHRVRLATHPTFRQLVEENGLEFFSIGGDPAELMAFMVKNPGLMPGFETLRSGDVGKRRKGMYEIIKGCWRSCIEAGDGTGAPPRDDYMDDGASFDSGISMSGDQSARPFIADIIIANPPSFAHIHCAEKLGIPLHLIFTMPWSPTQAFPHPLANIQSSNADTSITNFVSYALVEMMTWQGLGDVINRFREKTLRLEPVSVMWAPGMLSRLRIPYTYCWSPALIPKPRDWGSHIDISGFFFLSLASSYVPDPDLVAFLDAGPPPVYIGFGSIVVDDPNALSRLIFEAVRKAGVRALVSKGWGGLGTDELGVPEGVFMLGNVPHDWLFKHVSAVVHHGGAGTTAAGVALGKPTVVVPFFGDQPFWGSMIARAGAGPQPIPHKQLTADNLAAALLEALEPATQQRAAELGEKIGKELGAEIGAKNFHDQLDINSLRCSLSPGRVAVWRVKRTKVRLSALAATVLGQEGLLELRDLKLYRPREYDSEDGPWDPISGGASALIGTIGSLMMGVADFPVDLIKVLTKSQDGDRKTAPASTARTASGVVSPTSSHSPSISDLNVEVPNGATSQLTPTSSDTSTYTAEKHGSPVATPSTGAEGGSLTLDPSQPRQQTLSSPSSAASEAPAGRHKHSLAQAFSRHLTHSHSLEQPASPGSHLHRTHSDCPICKNTVDVAIEAGQGVGRIVEAGLKSPMDFTLAIARGFHNVPKLYGDKTVRAPDRVTGIQSGLKTAGKEFGYGFYDGVSGLVTQPLQGARTEGAAGFVKGLGKGFGGLILKPGAAIFGLPGYTFKGIYKELQKQTGPSTNNYIMAARTAQGFEDLKTSSQEERLEIIDRWKSMQDDIRKARLSFAEETRESMTEFKVKKQRTIEEYKRQLKEKKESKEMQKKDQAQARSHPHGLMPHLLHSRTFPGTPAKDGQHPDFEEAIRSSVAATSKGDAEQDEMIERAIRASVKELVAAHHDDANEDDAYHRAIQASVSETRRTGAADEKLKGRDIGSALPDDDDDDDDDDEALKEALHRSLQEYRLSEPGGHSHDGGADESSLQKALEESKLLHSQREEAEARVRAEEEIVLEHVKRLSLS